MTLISKLYDVDVYESIDELPIYNWDKIMSTGEYKYLLKGRIKLSKEINILLSVDDSIELVMDRAITIGLLINEIMSNCMKYAFKGRKKGNTKRI